MITASTTWLSHVMKKQKRAVWMENITKCGFSTLPFFFIHHITYAQTREVERKVAASSDTKDTRQVKSGW